ncbi:uncharacterized protein LOC125491149 [Plutella xylostella]|uniref:uncharacterized protein LOC125491149 n=1 Tax=Plutella xylostella TaxID=51655 RepID=UPI002032E803|nr:uncharacterized protein LOC125491149 [Plutella xylostella]
MGTGGGPPCKIIITPVDERIISLISKASIYGAEDVPVSSIFPLLEDHPAGPSPSCSSVVGSLEPSATTSAPATQDNYEVEEAVTTPVDTNTEAVQDPHHPTAEDVQRPDERESRAIRTPRPFVVRG